MLAILRNLVEIVKNILDRSPFVWYNQVWHTVVWYYGGA